MHVESLAMWTIPHKVSCVPAHETLMFLLLVVIHSLCHPQGQSLYVVWFRWCALHQDQDLVGTNLLLQ